MSEGIIFDHHALISVGAGNRKLSAYIVAAHDDPLFAIAVPAACLAEATRQRPAIATHVSQLPALEVPSLDRIAAGTAGQVAQMRWPEEGWPVLHAVTLSLTTGWEIATTRPAAYKGFGVPVMPVAG